MRIPALFSSLVVASAVLAQPGALDQTFADAGILQVDSVLVGQVTNGIVTLPNNTLLVCGDIYRDDTLCGAVIHLLNDGTIDMTFGENGLALLRYDWMTEANDLAVAQDGGILVIGTLTHQNPLHARAMLAKLLPDGTPDTSFGIDGVTLLDIGGSSGMLNRLTLQEDGMIVVCGSTLDGNQMHNGLVMRFTADGFPDPTFSGDGILVNTAFQGMDDLFDVVVLSDAAIIAVGQTIVASQPRTVLLKTDPTGVLDPTFGAGGILTLTLGPTGDCAFGAVAQGDKLLICGYLQTLSGNRDVYVASLHGEGALDPAFGVGGMTVIDEGDHEWANDLAIASDGKILLCGTTDPEAFGLGDILLARLNVDGSMDGSFGNNGIVITGLGDISNVQWGFSLAIQSDGRIVVSGYTDGSSQILVVARYLDQGCVLVPTIISGALLLCPNSSTELTTVGFDTYQWYKNGAAIPGATSQTLTVSSADDVGSWFKVLATMDTCYGFSDSVLVDGYAFLPPSIINEGDAPNSIGDSGEQIYCQGDDPVLVLGSPYDTNVQWFNSGSPIAGANSPQLAVSGPGSYSVEGAPSVCPDFVQNAGVEVVMEFHPYVQPTIYASGILLCPQPEGLSAQWYYNGSPVAGLDQCVIPIDAGSYTVFVDYGDSCSVLSAPYIVVGVEERDGTDLALMPNPASTTITLRAADVIGPWRIFDITGREAAHGLETGARATIDVSSLAEGRYFLRAGSMPPISFAVVR